MEWFTRIHFHSIVEPLCQPLKILAEKRVGLFAAYIRNNGFEFVPRVCYKRTKRFINLANINKPLRDKQAERLHLLGEVKKHNLITGRKFSPFIKGGRNFS